MASSVDVTIPVATTSASSKPYTIYNISLRQPLRSYTVQKRYSDFVSLHSALTSQTGSDPPAPLPGKSWFKSTLSNPELTEERRKGLEAYVQAINKDGDSRWRRCEAWRQFLNLPANFANGSAKGAGSQAAASATRAADLQSQIVDPNIWLDLHRELKAQLGDARQALRRRVDASTAQVQHEASADAKRYLVRSVTTVAALEAGLQRLSEVAKESRKGKSTKEDDIRGVGLGEGEVRRRRDLLSAAKKERDALEMQLLSFATRDASQGGDAAAATEEQKVGLFKGAGAGQGQSSGRRVLGGPVKETERTRELDNQGVLQLQKQIMQEQDEDATDLTKTVRRMKEMGIQINEELAYQNEMLGMLDQDVERVGDKIAVAKKRVDTIK